MGDPSDASSYWFVDGPDPSFSPVDRNVRVDVAIVGAGITGLTTALHLIEAGRTVAVIEANRVASGTSGHTTAKLTAQHGLVYSSLIERFGRRKAQQYADANQAAIEEVERRIDELAIDADFQRTPASVYASPGSETAALRNEAKISSELGLPAEYDDAPDGPVPMAGALRFREQAQFHPRRYLLALAAAIEDAGGSIHEKTRATDVKAGPPARIQTDREQTVTADAVVLASLFPIADRMGYFSRMHPSRAYLLVVELEEPAPAGMYLSSDDSPWTFRPLPASDRHLMLVGGQSHKMAAAVSTSDRYRRCASFAREHFPVRSIEHRWTAHDYVPVDGVPFIGHRGPIAKNIYVGTGFNKWGMTGGTAAGIILTGLIEDGEHPWEDVFDPMRMVPSAAGTYLRENFAVGSRWIADRIRGETTEAQVRRSLDRGEGTVIRHRGRPTAVTRDDDGTVHAVSAVCPHMWCLVEWNDVDDTWDCPCHGSRFGVDGTMLYGPAVEDLTPRDL